MFWQWQPDCSEELFLGMLVSGVVLFVLLQGMPFWHEEAWVHVLEVSQVLKSRHVLSVSVGTSEQWPLLHNEKGEGQSFEEEHFFKHHEPKRLGVDVHTVFVSQVNVLLHGAHKGLLTGVHAKSSSMCPSQLLSMPSHASLPHVVPMSFTVHGAPSLCVGMHLGVHEGSSASAVLLQLSSRLFPHNS